MKMFMETDMKIFHQQIRYNSILEKKVSLLTINFPPPGHPAHESEDVAPHHPEPVQHPAGGQPQQDDDGLGRVAPAPHLPGGHDPPVVQPDQHPQEEEVCWRSPRRMSPLPDHDPAPVRLQCEVRLLDSPRGQRHGHRDPAPQHRPGCRVQGRQSPRPRLLGD